MSNEKKRFERTVLLIGEEKMERLRQCRILLVGLGGVGSFAAEFLARAGVGHLTIADGDTVDITNINRQLPALSSTVGQSKARLMENRIRDINPDIQLRVLEEFLSPERMQEIVREPYDYAVDCIDSLQPKLNFLSGAFQQQMHVVSSMGAGGRTDATRIKITDIGKTKDCPFALHVRKGLYKMGIRKGITAVYSEEPADKNSVRFTDGTHFKRSFYGTISYLPAAFGLHMANYIVNHRINAR